MYARYFTSIYTLRNIVSKTSWFSPLPIQLSYFPTWSLFIVLLFFLQNDLMSQIVFTQFQRTGCAFGCPVRVERSNQHWRLGHLFRALFMGIERKKNMLWLLNGAEIHKSEASDACCPPFDRESTMKTPPPPRVFASLFCFSNRKRHAKVVRMTTVPWDKALAPADRFSLVELDLYRCGPIAFCSCFFFVAVACKTGRRTNRMKNKRQNEISRFD